MMSLIGSIHIRVGCCVEWMISIDSIVFGCVCQCSPVGESGRVPRLWPNLLDFGIRRPVMPLPIKRSQNKDET